MKQEQMLMIALAFLAGYFLNRLMGREGWSDADWTTGWPSDTLADEMGSLRANWTYCKQIADENNNPVRGIAATIIKPGFCNSKAEECMSNRISEFLGDGSDLDMANRMAISSCLGTSDTSQYIDSGGIIPAPVLTADQEPSVPPPDPPPCDSIAQFFGSISDLTDVCLGFDGTRSKYSCTHSDACHTAAFNARNCATNFPSIPGSDKLDNWTEPCSTPL